MGKFYTVRRLFAFAGLCLLISIASCKKDSKAPKPPTTTVKPIAVLGLYEVQGSIYRRVYIPFSVGTADTLLVGVFDTGSSAMTVGAQGLIPKSMWNDNGITIPGDSLVVNGITVTKQTSTLVYGDATAGTKEYGNLAYATVKIGDDNGSVTTKRIPFFLYYKAIDTKSNTKLDPHENDVFGVGPNTSFNGLQIASPISYFTMPANLTQGFKLAKFDKNKYSTNGTYVSDLLTIGLVPEDLTSNGFIMHSLTHTTAGYSPNIAATITYNGKSIQGSLLFDTGTPAFTNIEDTDASMTPTTLPANSPVTITTSAGFSYQYTTTADINLTQIENPKFTGDPRTIFSINFFNDNQFLLDYTNHKIGLKN